MSFPRRSTKYHLYNTGKGEIELFINRARNEGPAYAVFKVFNILFMIFIIVVTLFPYLNVLAKALNDGQDSMRGGITLWPRKFTWENFRILLNDSSLWLALCVTLGKLVNFFELQCKMNILICGSLIFCLVVK